jgi:hypothetical protein
MERVSALELIEGRTERLVCVEALGLIGFAKSGVNRGDMLSSISALPVGDAINVRFAIEANGTLQSTFSYLSPRHDAQSGFIRGLSSWLAPGCAFVASLPRTEESERTTLVPMLMTFPKQAAAATRFAAEESKTPSAIRQVNQWPWDITNALAILSQNGGGTLDVRVQVVPPTAQLTRTIESQIADYQGKLYAEANNQAWPLLVAARRAILQDDAVLLVDVAISGTQPSTVVLDLMSLALFGSQHDSAASASDAVQRCLAGSCHAPLRLYLLQNEAQSLLDRAAASTGFGNEGSVIGRVAGSVPVYLNDRDRGRHLYVIGATGTGKSTLLRGLIGQDIAQGKSVVLIDPHGDLSKEVLRDIPRERHDEVIFADASEEEGKFGLNLLPRDGSEAELEIATDVLTQLFQSVMYAKVDAFGPMFDLYFRNALTLLVEASHEYMQPKDLIRIFIDDSFRNSLISICPNAAVVSFWKNIAHKTSGDNSFANYVPYVTSKLTRLVGTEVARRVFPAASESLDIGGILNAGKVLILRCPKGDLGEGLSDLAVAVAVMKIRQAVMARASSQTRRPISLYIDEFQGCGGDSLQGLMAEGRKFGLSVTLANQSLGQIGGTTNGSLGSAILANVGNLIAFRVGAPDAVGLSPWLGQDDHWQRLCRLPDFHMAARILQNGRPINLPHLQSIARIGEI